MKKIPLSYYVAYNNPRKCQELLARFGKRPARNMDDLCRKMDALMVQHREEALNEIAAIHPDKGLILATNQVEEELSDHKSNACGCSGADGSGCGSNKKSNSCGCSGKSANRSSNADGDSPAPMPPSQNSMKQYLPPIIAGTFLLVAVVVILKHA